MDSTINAAALALASGDVLGALNRVALREDPPALALNFGRIKDDTIDESLDTVRSATEEAEVKAAAEAINKAFGEQVYNLWHTSTVWGIAKKPSVNGIDTFTLPDGQPTIFGNGIGGSHQIAQLWVEQ